MSPGPASSTSAFSTAARQQVRAVLELLAQRSPDSTARITAALGSVATDATALGLDAIATLARRGCEQAQLLDRDRAAVTALSRTVRELSRALEALVTVRGRVLVVDDSALNAAVVREALERAAFETQQAEDSDAAAAAVARFSPHVVLADVHMPDSTAAELCARMRAAAEPKKLHVILFSGLPDDELSELVRETRADGFLSKDRGLDSVVQTITNVCREILG